MQRPGQTVQNTVKSLSEANAQDNETAVGERITVGDSKQMREERQHKIITKKRLEKQKKQFN